MRELLLATRVGPFQTAILSPLHGEAFALSKALQMGPGHLLHPLQALGSLGLSEQLQSAVAGHEEATAGDQDDSRPLGLSTDLSLVPEVGCQLLDVLGCSLSGRDGPGGVRISSRGDGGLRHGSSSGSWTA